MDPEKNTDFPALRFNPDKREKPFIVSIKVCIDGMSLRKHEQSSANCFSLCSLIPIFTPCIF